MKVFYQRAPILNQTHQLLDSSWTKPLQLGKLHHLKDFLHMKKFTSPWSASSKKPFVYNMLIEDP